MRYVSAKATERDWERATRVMQEQPLPAGIERFVIEPNVDQDGEPVFWVWLDDVEAGVWTDARLKAFLDYNQKVERRLNEELEDYRAYFRLRTSTSMLPG